MNEQPILYRSLHSRAACIRINYAVFYRSLIYRAVSLSTTYFLPSPAAAFTLKPDSCYGANFAVTGAPEVAIMTTANNSYLITGRVAVLGWGLLSRFPPFRYSPNVFFCIIVKTHPLNITFIFDWYRRSSAAVAPVKYKCDSNNLKGTFARSNISL